ncbi:MAG: 4Fe-4S binding protein [Candidatus Delongbacteria bacterium]|nr:4Fe-4S binding protein [Candidatus Delongbacteria bacterium]MBN2836756.1 4Fe-4S binding protein [Candidatus Delongbacteria bacterium]
MTNDFEVPLVGTVKEKCRVCYTCVRECPAKAIKMSNGQAEIIPERCIACGNCVSVCSQNAKRYISSVDYVKHIIKSGYKVAAMIAPSFPAEFLEFEDYRIFVGILRRLGFKYVTEVAFGADLVAEKHQEILKKNTDFYYITSACPAVVSFIEKYHPSVVDHISNVVSPMIAMTRVVKEKYGENLKTVFIGPCIAKKHEADLDEFKGEIDAVLTFTELRELIEDQKIDIKECYKSEFDPPLGGKGSLFPISGGLLQSMDTFEDLTDGHVIVADGRHAFTEAIREFESGLLKNNHLDLLCCEGCIMGAGMSKGGKRFIRRAIVSDYVKNKILNLNNEKWHKYIEEFRHINLIRTVKNDDQRLLVNVDGKYDPQIKKILESMGKFKPEDELNCEACGYRTCKEHAHAILKGLAESEMCLPYTIEKMHGYIKKLGETNELLTNTQLQLQHSEKLATMGQLSAGIAHEVNNPLGVVLMYSHILMEETDKSSPFYEDLKMIATQADRCKNILSGLLNFARKNELRRKEILLSELIENSIGGVVIPSEIEIKINHKDKDGKISLDPDQMSQVISNLIKNSIDAMKGKGKIFIDTIDKSDHVIITLEDNGPGIPKENLGKLFEPFFTTKQIGKGTGLGLAVCYGIIKMHKGKISVESNAEPKFGTTYAKFTIAIPKNQE